MNMHIPDQVAAELDRVLTETLDVRCALRAALSAWVASGMAKTATGYEESERWYADTEDPSYMDSPFDALIIKTEAP